jgi:hypothetical protein
VEILFYFFDKGFKPLVKKIKKIGTKNGKDVDRNACAVASYKLK